MHGRQRRWRRLQTFGTAHRTPTTAEANTTTTVATICLTTMLVDNDYDLSINRYKKTEYVAVEYPPTGEIMADLDGLYKELGGVLEELGGLLNG